MKAKLHLFESAYRHSLNECLAGTDEIVLERGYELGRQAVRDGLGVMDIVSVHRLALLDLMAGVSSVAECMKAVMASYDFFTECLAPFELTHRGFLEVESLNKKLEEANKEMESFSYSVSHDLRAPLRAIEGYSRMILKKQAGNFDKETARQFEVIREHVHLMNKFIEDLLDLSRLGRQPIVMSMIDMSSLFKDVWEEFRMMNADRQMVLMMDHVEPGMGDKDFMKHVVYNLLSNATKFTKGRSDAVVEVGGYANEKENVYYVKDNGAGFNMTYYSKLFGVFQRLHSSEEFEGTGVGLAIVQRIIKRHGGRVWAEGEVDKGATFYFTIPAQDRSNSRATLIRPPVAE